MAHSRTRVLVIAEAANPEWVSVPLIGWSLARALAEVADVHLVTQVRNREAILRTGLIEGEDFTSIDSEALAKPLWAVGKALRMGEGKGWTALQAVSAVSYPYFERLIWKKFGPALRAGDYDIVHRVTPLSPTQVSPLAKKCAKIGVPFVVGPLNGGVPWPREFDSARRQEREWLSYLRGAYKAMPGRGAMLKSASAIIAGSRYTASEIPQAQQHKVVWLPENAVDPTRFTKQAAPAHGPLRGCFIGRMVPYKGPDMLLEAAAPLLKSGKMTLDFIGDGPVLPDLKAFAQSSGIADAVTFHGWLEHDRVQDVAASCSMLTFPSVREFGGGVVLEAMALGLAPLIVDYAGPSELITSDVGYTVPLGDRSAIIAGFRAELTRLADQPNDVAAKGRAARDMVADQFTWARKAEQILQVYEWVLAPQGARPEFAIGAMTPQLMETEDDAIAG